MKCDTFMDCFKGLPRVFLNSFWILQDLILKVGTQGQQETSLASFVAELWAGPCYINQINTINAPLCVKLWSIKCKMFYAIGDPDL